MSLPSRRKVAGRSTLTFAFGRAGWPKSHAVQETVTNDKRVEQHRAEVGQKRQEQEIRENRVRFAQYGIENWDCRENRRQMHWPEHDDRIVAGG
jgi:hypothetical protein